MNLVEKIVKASYVLIENVPKPYGAFHLIFVFLSLALIVAICYFARKNKDTTFRIVLFSVGMFLLLSEIYKQLLFSIAAGREGYDWDLFPFQLCSVPMYLAIAVGFMKKNMARDAICDYLACIGFLGGFMAYVEPSGILKNDYFSIAHSCIWHALLIFIALYILFTGNACRRLKDYRRALVVFGGVVLTATLLNVIFHNRDGFNMCYISPFYNTPLAVFKDFDVFFQDILGKYFGRIVSVFIYILGVCLGGFAIYSAEWAICLGIERKTKKSKTN